jgi:serine/threonine-protein phosphatase 6 regulatory ankyrin repeat subunit B
MAFRRSGLMDSNLRVVALTIGVIMLWATGAIAGVAEDLVTAAGRGDLPEVQRILSAGTDVNSVSKVEGTPLMAASRNGHLAVVRELIARGADVNAKIGGVTALMVASGTGHLEVVRELLGKGADVNARTDAATSNDAQEGLFSNGSNALILASMFGRIEVVRGLLANGADVNAKTYAGATALMVARGEEIRALLLKAGAK